MPEPSRFRVRPIVMGRTLVGTVLAVLLLAGCGSAEESARGGDGAAAAPAPSPTAVTPGGCTAPDGSSRVIDVLVDADLDGDGTRDAVGVTSEDDPCPGQLSAEVGDRDLTSPLPDNEPVVRSAFAVSAPGQTGQLVVTRQDHPRGGFQTRVFALAGDGLVELEYDGRALVPFVATDSQGQLTSIDCADGGIVVTSAMPQGAAWEVSRTAYALDGGAVTPRESSEAAESVPAAALKRQYPELVANAVFPSCRG